MKRPMNGGKGAAKKRGASQREPAPRSDLSFHFTASNVHDKNGRMTFPPTAIRRVRAGLGCRLHRSGLCGGTLDVHGVGRTVEVSQSSIEKIIFRWFVYVRWIAECSPSPENGNGAFSIRVDAHPDPSSFYDFAPRLIWEPVKREAPKRRPAQNAGDLL